MTRIHSKSGRFIVLLPDTPASGYSVVVTAVGVWSFRQQFPCNGFRSDFPIRFDFASNGDLVDIPYGDKETVNPDAGAAQLALSQDAQEFAEKCIARRVKR